MIQFNVEHISVTEDGEIRIGGTEHRRGQGYENFVMYIPKEQVHEFETAIKGSAARVIVEAEEEEV